MCIHIFAGAVFGKCSLFRTFYVYVLYVYTHIRQGDVRRSSDVSGIWQVCVYTYSAGEYPVIIRYIKEVCVYTYT